MIDIEFDSPENIKIYQEKLLGKALKYLEENSKYYKRMFSRYEIDIEKIQSIEDLVKIPFTEKTFIIKYNGVINGGVKPEEIEIINNTKDEIDIEIKKCQILDHYIDDENIYVYDVKNSIFNKLDTQEVLDDMSKYKKEYEQKIINEGFLEEVQENTKVSIENILKGLGYSVVNINFK